MNNRFILNNSKWFRHFFSQVHFHNKLHCLNRPNQFYIHLYKYTFISKCKYCLFLSRSSPFDDFYLQYSNINNNKETIFLIDENQILKEKKDGFL